jgi:hypothetical protein
MAGQEKAGDLDSYMSAVVKALRRASTRERPPSAPRRPLDADERQQAPEIPGPEYRRDGRRATKGQSIP